MFKFISELRRFKNWLKFTGSSRMCPICKSGARKFCEYGVIRRPDAMCPFCGSLERHRLLWLFLERKMDVLRTAPTRTLHVAPERVLETKLRPLLGEGYLTADLLDPDVDVKMDITDIQYPDRSFDFIYCSHVLEHVLDDRKAMSELRRVLTDDGVAILPVPITAKKTFEDPSVVDPKERLRLFGQEDHVRCYGEDYPDRLQEQGFTVEVIIAEDFLTPKEIEKMGMLEAPGEIFYCTKCLS